MGKTLLHMEDGAILSNRMGNHKWLVLYAFVLVGTRYGIGWMTWLGGIWMSFLWFPLTIEKPITIFIAGLLYRIVYRESFIPKIEGEENAL